MKSGLWIALLTVGLLSLSAAKKVETEVAKHENPDNEALRAAISELYKAINTKSDSNRDQYIQNARKLLEVVEQKVVYPAQIICDGKSLWKIKADFDHCQSWLEICFKGDKKAALTLMNIAISQSLLGSDEEWFENARLENDQLFVTFVDGPNEYQDEHLVPLCK